MDGSTLCNFGLGNGTRYAVKMCGERMYEIGFAGSSSEKRSGVERCGRGGGRRMDCWGVVGTGGTVVFGAVIMV